MKKFFYPATLTILLFAISCGQSETKSNEEEVVDLEVREKTFEERIKEAEVKIKNSPEWVAQLEQKAKANNMSLDSQIFYDAKWIVEDEIKRAASEAEFQKKLAEAEKSIRENKEWLATVEKKAKEQNIPLDTMIKRDAEYTVREQQNNN
jgi:hypothetical protein